MTITQIWMMMMVMRSTQYCGQSLQTFKFVTAFLVPCQHRNIHFMACQSFLVKDTERMRKHIHIQIIQMLLTKYSEQKNTKNIFNHFNSEKKFLAVFPFNFQSGRLEQMVSFCYCIPQVSDIGNPAYFFVNLNIVGITSSSVLYFPLKY